jgi:hypothetical protein
MTPAKGTTTLKREKMHILVIREAHSLAASPSTNTRREACRVAAQEHLSHQHSPPKTRSSFAPDYRRFRSLRLRAGGRPRLATSRRTAADRHAARCASRDLCSGVRPLALYALGRGVTCRSTA